MSDTIIVCPSSGAVCKHAGCAAGPCWAMAWEQPVRYVRAAPPPADDAVSEAMVEAAWEVLYGHTLNVEDGKRVRRAIAAALAARGR